MTGGEAPYAYSGLNRLFHERARLGVVSSLAGHTDGLGFSELKTLCGLTDGNLNRHLAVLEDAGLVALKKGYEGKRPHTRCCLTEAGRAGFAAYLDALQDVLRKASRAGGSAAARGMAPKPA